VTPTNEAPGRLHSLPGGEIGFGGIRPHSSHWNPSVALLLGAVSESGRGVKSCRLAEVRKAFVGWGGWGFAGRERDNSFSNPSSKDLARKWHFTSGSASLTRY
jgi:hypothetical protein